MLLWYLLLHPNISTWIVSTVLPWMVASVTKTTVEPGGTRLLFSRTWLASRAVLLNRYPARCCIGPDFFWGGLFLLLVFVQCLGCGFAEGGAGDGA
jgi:hypothetical protein